MIEEYLDDFKREAAELITQLEDNTLKLESNLGDTSLIEAIFRDMHTLKGTAAMFGFADVQIITHELETVYDQIRSGERRVNTVIIDATLQAIDVTKHLLEGKKDEQTFNALLETIQDTIEGGVQQASVTSVTETQRDESSGVYIVLYTPRDDIFNRGVNPMSPFEELGEIGTYKELLHEKGKPLQEQLDEHALTAIWEIYVATADGLEAIEDVFLFFKEEEYQVYSCTELAGQLPKDFEEQLKNIDPEEKYSLEERLNLLQELNSGATRVTEDNTPEEEGMVTDKATTLPGEGQETNGEMAVTVNVASDKLDEMMNLVSDLVTAQSELNVIALELKSRKLLEVTEKIDRLTKRFRDNAIEIRLVPIRTMEVQLKRLVRDLGKQLGKELEFISEGMDTELDKTIINSLESPLIHIIRNSIDHGLEPPEERLQKNKREKGIIKFTSFYSGSSVIIQVQDDGRGINLDKVREAAVVKGYIQANTELSDKETLNLILAPGFTTSENVSMVSGRGVGMDVVQKEVAVIRGELEIHTEKDLGTVVAIKLPLTLSILDTILVRTGDMYFLIPVTDIEFVYEESDSVVMADNNTQINYQGELLPYIMLRDIFHMEQKPIEEHVVLVINKDEKRYAILVDQIKGEHQAVLKPLGEVFKNMDYLLGSSILGNGKLAFIIDTSKLYELTAEGATY